uniref:Uncharacterized protein n=1 Tax=Rhizophora mucronata TaxID=61149 RepID=A0A2P2QKE3_RHIMU
MDSTVTDSCFSCCQNGSSGRLSVNIINTNKCMFSELSTTHTL